MLKTLCGFFAVAFCFFAFCDEPTSESDQAEKAIRSVLKEQNEAWNRGDIPGFMEGYLKSKELRFASGDTVTFGWQTTLDRYLKGYPDRETMGTLTFSDIKVLVLSKSHAEVFGRWHLKRSEEKGDAMGRFTLLMQKTPEGWRVFHDHTSSAKTE